MPWKGERQLSLSLPTIHDLLRGRRLYFSLSLSLSCEDSTKAEEVRRASKRIRAMSAELIGCANRVAEEGEGEEESPQLLEDQHETLESTELLRRDWASQVQ